MGIRLIEGPYRLKPRRGGHGFARALFLEQIGQQEGHVDRLLGIGYVILAAGAACLLLAGWLGGISPLPMILAISVVTLANGFLIPLSFAGGVTSFPDSAGAASGLMGAMHLTAGSLAIYLVAAMPGTVSALAAFVTVVAAIGCLAFPVLLRRSNMPRAAAPVACTHKTTA